MDLLLKVVRNILSTFCDDYIVIQQIIPKSDTIKYYMVNVALFIVLHHTELRVLHTSSQLPNIENKYISIFIQHIKSTHD